MSIIYKYNNDNVNFNEVKDILTKAFTGRKFTDVSNIEKSFINSSHVVYAYDNNKLIGFARAISDSTWAIIYNVALDPKYQGKGIGKKIINDLVKNLGDRHIFTFTHPRTISLYEHLSFVRSKMAFKYVKNTDKERISFQEEAGFFLEDNYLFDGEKKSNNKRINNNDSITYSNNLNNTSIIDINKLLEKAFNNKRDIDKTLYDFRVSQFVELAFDNNKLIGCARLLTDGVGEAILLNVCVDPDYQKRGIGLEIIERLCSQAKDFDIFIHTHPKALSFYNNSRDFKRYKTAFSYEKDDNYSKEFFLPRNYRYKEELKNEEIKYYKGKILN